MVYAEGKAIYDHASPLPFVSASTESNTRLTRIPSTHRRMEARVSWADNIDPQSSLRPLGSFSPFKEGFLPNRQLGLAAEMFPSVAVRKCSSVQPRTPGPFQMGKRASPRVDLSSLCKVQDDEVGFLAEIYCFLSTEMKGLGVGFIGWLLDWRICHFSR